MPKHRRLIVEQVGDETRVRFADSKIHDKPNIEAIADELFHLVERLDRRKLLLDFGNIDYLSSAALGKLVSLNKKLQSVDGSLTLCNVPAKIYKVFQIAKLESMFSIERLPGDDDTQEEAARGPAGS